MQADLSGCAVAFHQHAITLAPRALGPLLELSRAPQAPPLMRGSGHGVVVTGFTRTGARDQRVELLLLFCPKQE
jgi:hypothetical protein